jgi:hypothetical protein
MRRRTPVYVICSPRPRVGKTLLARLMVEFFLTEGRSVAAFDVNPNEFALAEFLPRHTAKANLNETLGQMALFDKLIQHDEVPKVVDLGYAAFEAFFDLMQEIDFLHEARRRSIMPVLLFVANPDRTSRKSYDMLHDRFRLLPLIPVYNEANAQEHHYREAFPAEHGSPLRIPALPPVLKGVTDKPAFSFADFLDKSANTETLLHPWIRRVFIELRELELRLLLDQLRFSLPLPT